MCTVLRCVSGRLQNLLSLVAQDRGDGGLAGKAGACSSTASPMSLGARLGWSPWRREDGPLNPFAEMWRLHYSTGGGQEVVEIRKGFIGRIPERIMGSTRHQGNVANGGLCFAVR